MTENKRTVAASPYLATGETMTLTLDELESFDTVVLDSLTAWSEHEHELLVIQGRTDDAGRLLNRKQRRAKRKGRK